jgi:hypothetical protein
MASDARAPLLVVAAVALAAGCAGPARFPLREPMATDTDRTPVAVPCHAEPTPKEPDHLACSPAVYVSPLAWDGVDNSIFRPLSDALAVRATHEAVNANALDEVADSAWFENRIGAHPIDAATLARAACEPKQILAGLEDAPEASIVIDKGKDNGASPGFRVKIPGKGKYLFKTDSGTVPGSERPSAAAVLGAAAYYAAGFHFSCEQVVYVRRSSFKLTPGLTVTDNSERVRPFDQAALDKVFDAANRRGDLIRFQASAWLEGKLIGPFRYEGTRADDPNDVIAHEDRRELRGGRLLAAWLDHFDAREQNSMDVWVASDPSRPDSSPGYVRHYYLDTSDTLGSEWDWDAISRRLGHSYLLGWGDISADFLTLGLRERRWDRAVHEPGQEVFGYFTAKDFDPETWVNEYPNPAFSRMTERDGAWMARVLAGFTPDLVRELAKLGRFTKPENTEYLAQTLEARLQAILARYLTVLSPIGLVHVAGEQMCGVDLAERRGVRPPADFAYVARLADGTPLTATRPAPAEVCVAVPHTATDAASAAPDAPERYRTLSIADGVARGALVVHLYDLGPTGGYRLVGLERPEGR